MSTMSFNKDYWLNRMREIPAMYCLQDPPINQHSDASYGPKGLLTYAYDDLNKRTYGGAEIYPNQIACGIEVFIHAMADVGPKGNRVISVSAQTQSGKTGIQIASHYLVHHFKVQDAVPHLLRRLALQLPSDRGLVRQNQHRFRQFSSSLPFTPFGRSGLSNLCQTSNKLKQKFQLAKNAPDEAVLEKLAKKVQQRHNQGENGFEKAPFILPGTFLTIDESHYGSGEEGVMNRILKNSGIYLDQDPDTWDTEDVTVVTFSATPIAQNMSAEHQPWVRQVVARPGKGYTGIAELYEQERIKDAWKIYDNASAKSFVSVLSRNLMSSKEHPAFGLLRLQSKAYNSKKDLIIDACLGQGYKILDENRFPTISDQGKYDLAIIELNQKSPNDIREGLCSPDSDGHDVDTGWLSEPPPIPTLVILKDMLKMGASVCDKHIAFVFERVVPTSNADFIYQSLLGRCTGYNKGDRSFPIYTSLDSTNQLLIYIADDFAAASSPMRATRARSHKKTGYTNFNQSFNVKFEEGIRTLKGMSELLDAAIGSAEDEELKRRLQVLGDSEKVNKYKRYYLYQWKEGRSQKKATQIIKASSNEVSTQTKRYLNGSSASCFIKGYDSKTGRVEIFWNFAQDAEEVFIQNSTSMYGSLAAK